jgi:hypothetical protein
MAKFVQVVAYDMAEARGDSWFEQNLLGLEVDVTDKSPKTKVFVN